MFLAFFNLHQSYFLSNPDSTNSCDGGYVLKSLVEYLVKLAEQDVCDAFELVESNQEENLKCFKSRRDISPKILGSCLMFHRTH